MTIDKLKDMLKLETREVALKECGPSTTKPTNGKTKHQKQKNVMQAKVTLTLQSSQEVTKMSFTLNTKTTEQLADIFNGRTSMYGNEAREYCDYRFSDFDLLVLQKDGTIKVVPDY